jgi:hypothetical protein
MQRIVALVTVAFHAEEGLDLHRLIRTVESDGSIEALSSLSEAQQLSALQDVLSVAVECSNLSNRSNATNISNVSAVSSVDKQLTLLRGRAELAHWAGNIKDMLQYYCNPLLFGNDDHFYVGHNLEGELDPAATDYYHHSSPLPPEPEHPPLEITAHKVPPGLGTLHFVQHVKSAMSADECHDIIRAAEHSGQWELALHTPYPTLDQHAADMPPVHRILNRKLEHMLLPLLERLFSVDVRSLWVKEAVVIKYDAGSTEGRQHVANHRDSSFLSFNILLSPTSDFTGGGTHFTSIERAIYLEQGDAVMHSGKLEHRLVVVGQLPKEKDDQ